MFRLTGRFFAVIIAIGFSLSGSANPISDLSRWVKAAPLQYQVPNSEEIAREAEALRVSLSAARAKVEGARGFETDEVFLLPELSAEISSESPSVETLEKIYGGMCTDRKEPVDMADFEWRQLRLNLYEFLKTVRASHLHDAQAKLEARRLQLASSLEKLAAEPSDREAFSSINDQYRWLVNHRQASEITTALRTHFRRANQYAVVGSSVISGLLRQELKQSMPIDQYSQGVHVTGQGSAEGVGVGALVANEKRGEIRINLSATASAENIRASRGNATVWVDSHSAIHGYQTIYFNPDSFSLSQGPQAIEVSTRTEPHSSSYRTKGILPGGVRAGIALAIAKRKAPEMSRESSLQIKKEVSTQVQEQAEEMVAIAGRAIHEQFRAPLVREHRLPTLAVRSTPDAISLEGVFAAEEDLTFAGPVPSYPVHATDMRAYAHESAFCQAGRILEGEKIEEAEFREVFFGKMGLTVPPDFDVIDESPSYLTLADHKPLRVQFQDNKMQLGIAVKAFRANGKTRKERVLEITGTYVPRVDRDDSGKTVGITVIREGEVVVRNGETDQLLGATDGDDVDALLSIVDKFLVKGASSHGIQFNGDLKKVGKFVAKDIRVTDGWITVSWRHEKSTGEK